MLELMRKKSKYFLWLFVIVILSFVFWGIGTNDIDQPVQILAEVGPYKVTAEEYFRAYDRIQRFYRDIYKEAFTEEMQQKLNLKEKVLDTLVANRVLLIAASENGIIVTDQELNDTIKSDPAFMKDKTFDESVYLNRLRLSRLTPKAYESLRREELMVQKVQRLIELSVRVPDDMFSSMNISEQNLKTIKESLLSSEREKAIQSYVNGMKKKYAVKINKEIIS